MRRESKLWRGLAGVRLSTYKPLELLEAAVTRKLPGEASMPPRNEAQAVSLAEAIIAMTRNSAFKLGSLSDWFRCRGQEGGPSTDGEGLIRAIAERYSPNSGSYDHGRRGRSPSAKQLADFGPLDCLIAIQPSKKALTGSAKRKPGEWAGTSKSPCP